MFGNCNCDVEQDTLSVELLRSDLMDYYGSSMSVMPGFAVLNVSFLENATPEDIIDMSREVGLL